MNNPSATSTDQAFNRLLPADENALAALAGAAHGAPFCILGPHPVEGGWVVRALLPGADSVDLLVADGTRAAMTKIHDDGIFAVQTEMHPGLYKLAAKRVDDSWQVTDPYQFAPRTDDLDEYLFAEGTHQTLWRMLGAHPCTLSGVQGTRFAVWAPNATRVSVVGDFNAWDGRLHPMGRRGSTGIWEVFIPDTGPGARYKYEIATTGREAPFTKSDPVGFGAEMRPDNSSVVRSLDEYTWQDSEWTQHRAKRQTTQSPVSIYEVHPGSWRRHEDGSWLSYRDLAETLVPYVRDMGFTHIELLPVSEHPFDGSWGYQPVGLYAPTSRFGTADDFRFFTDACHAAGLGLILDWVPAHFPDDPHGLARFDGTALYEHEDPREGYHPDWNTFIYNLGRPEVSNFLLANALYWAREHHIDGLRVDAVASMLYRDYSRKDGEWIPNKHGGRENLEAISFLQNLNKAIRSLDPSVMVIAEESTAWPGVTRPVEGGGLGFGYKWNMGWMHDALEYMKKDPLYRSHHHDQMSFSLHYAFSENFVLPVSHDEVVHGKGSMFGKMPGDEAAKLANLRAFYTYMWAHPGKKLLFMGQEFGQQHEWDADGQLSWTDAEAPGHMGLQHLVRDLNHLYRDTPALHRADCSENGFEWIDGAAKDGSVFAWMRKSGEDDPAVLAVFNFSGAEHSDWRLGVPHAGYWREMVNSDAAQYGGGNRATAGGAATEPVASHGRDHSVNLTLPPLSGRLFIWEKP